MTERKKFRKAGYYISCTVTRFNNHICFSGKFRNKDHVENCV